MGLVREDCVKCGHRAEEKLQGGQLENCAGNILKEVNSSRNFLRGKFFQELSLQFIRRLPVIRH